MAKGKSIEEMLNMAVAGSEDSGEGNVAALLSGEPAPRSVKEPVAVPPEPVRIESEEREPVYKKPVYNEPRRVQPQPEKKEPVYTKSRGWDVKEEKPVAPVFKPMNKISSLSVGITERIIDSFVFYNGLNESEKNTIAGFLRINDKNKIPEIIFSAIQLEESKATNLNNLVDLYEMDGVSRAWSLIELDNETLLGISENTALFSEGYTPKSNITNPQEKISFARELEKAISNINVEIMNNLLPVREFLIRARSPREE